MDSAEVDPAGRAYVFHGNDHFPVYWYPDPEHPLARLHRIVAQKVPREMIEVVSASDDMAVAVARVSSGRRPSVYLVVDAKTANSSAGFFEFPTLRGTRLTKVDPVIFQARDGLLIRGYLTTPEDASGRPRRNLPLVVIAHDGPLGQQASAAYEYERQLFASRGYAVLQVNRRGTPGRGAAYERAGDGKWGRETQDDFIDGVRWAIKDGVADGSRVCFYGSGYGGFSAMVAAAHEPDMFKCIVGVSGVYDLPDMLPDGEKEFPAAMVADAPAE
jgi:dipeptidyl aminopeptidase/acylaminoacyl peptidase